MKSLRSLAGILTAGVAVSAIAASGITASALTATSATDNLRGQPRIVGGERAPEGAYPWMTKIQISAAGGTYNCGGTVISKDIILTAQHCVEDARSFSFYIGKNSWRDGEKRSGTQVKAGAGPKSGDWAVIKMTQPVTTTGRMALPGDTSFDKVTTKYRTMGWGTTSEGGSSSDYLLQVDVPYVEPGKYDCSWGEQEICAGYPEGKKDSCQGDSGGPLLSPNGSSWVQTGVVSWGEGCAKANFPGHYAKVSRYLKDIQQAITSLGGEQPQIVTGSGQPNPNPQPSQPAPWPTQPAPQPTQPAPWPTQPAPQPTQPAPWPTQPAPQPTGNPTRPPRPTPSWPAPWPTGPGSKPTQPPAPQPTQPAPWPTQPTQPAPWPTQPTQPAPWPTQPAPQPTQPAPWPTQPPAPQPTQPPAPQPTPAPGGALQIKPSDADFQATVLDRSNSITVFVQFSASWCGYCKKLSPIMDKYNKMDNSWVWAYFDTDKSKNVPKQFGIGGIPDTRVIKKGKEVGRLDGYEEDPIVREFINKYK